jgi:CheY-like chemotaxis protein
LKILIVDDNDARRFSLSNFLSGSNEINNVEIYETDCADGVKELLAIHYFDVLILDVVLPKRSRDTPHPMHGLGILEQLSRSVILKRPERIIGITAHVNDLGTFRQTFDRFCFSIVEAGNNTVGWKTQVLNSITYIAGSRLDRAIAEKPLHVLSVHGIMTFGDWQSRLKNILARKKPDVGFHSYKYGYFPVFDFLLPIVRRKEVERLAKHLEVLFLTNEKVEFIIFCHSFGTYLVAKAMLSLFLKNGRLPVRTVVLSGSVLPENFDWSFARQMNFQIINDCADKDYILYVSKLFVWGTGMAGKCGFIGFNDEKILNRYFQGGHSSYFNGDNFMEEFWLPVVGPENFIEVDKREISFFHHGLCDPLVKFFGDKKGWIFFILFTLLMIYILNK